MKNLILFWVGACALLGGASFASERAVFAHQAIDQQLVRMERFLRERKNAEGITPDVRDTPYPTEVIRLNVAPQALGYLELYRKTRSRTHLREAVDRANYLVRNFSSVLRHRDYDGMIGYALLSVFKESRIPQIGAYGDRVVQEMLKIPTTDLRLNTGLMAALALAKSYELQPRASLLVKLKTLVQQLRTEQNPDGSFPHAYDGRDIHYSAWMAMELKLIEQALPRNSIPMIATIVRDLTQFLKARIPLTADDHRAKMGEPVYTETVCTSLRFASCKVENYYAAATAHSPEYDTRAWSNELGYEVFAFAAAGANTHLERVLTFLRTLDHQGAFPDKWAFPIDPELNPDQYPFSNQAQSVIRTSLVFWSLAATRNLKN